MTHERQGDQERLDSIERRLQAIERAMGLVPPAPPMPSPLEPASAAAPLSAVASTRQVTPLPAPTASVTQPGAPASAEAPLQHEANTEGVLESKQRVLIGMGAQAGQERTWAARPGPANSFPRVSMWNAARPSAWKRPDLEALIGGRWYAVVGALVFIIGIGLLITLAVREGWFGHLPPTLKCSVGALVGLGLLGSGGWLQRKGNAWGAVGVFAAGLGSLFASVYSAYAVYDLMGPTLAFVCLVATAVLGVAVGAFTDSLTVSLIALIGGYLTPILVHTDHPKAYVFPAYLIMLQLVGLSLSAWKGAGFAWLRALTWWATLLMGTAWGLGLGGREQAFGLAFVGIEWLVVHGELWVYTQRLAEGRIRPVVRMALVRRGAPSQIVGAIAGSFITTAWATVLGVFFLDTVLPGERWMAPAALMAGAGVVGFTLAGHLRAMLDTPESDRERLGASMAVQAGALLVATVALGITGWAQSLAWIALGAGFAAASVWTRLRPLIVYGLIVLGIATARLVLLEPLLGGPGLWAGPVNAMGLVLTAWTALMAGAAAGWLCTAALAWNDDAPLLRRASRVAAAMGVLVLMASVQDSRAAGTSVCAAWLLIAMVAHGVSRLPKARGVAWLALTPLLLASARLMTLEAVNSFGRSGVEFAGLVLNPWHAVMLAASGLWIAASVLATSVRTARVLFAVGIGMAMFGLTHEHAEPRSVVLSWLAIAATLLASARFVRRLPGEIYVFAVLGAASAFWGATAIPEWTASKAPLGLHPDLAVAVSLIALAAWLSRTLRAQAGVVPAFGLAAGLSAGAGVVLLFAASSAEVLRVATQLVPDVTARSASLSVWWGVFAIGLLAAGLTLKNPLARYAGLGLLAIATLKALVLDLAEVSLAWRVVSFLSLGAIMMVVAVVYGRVAKKQPPQGEGPPHVP